MDHTCAPPEGGVESGEQPDRQPNRPATKSGSERPGLKRERETDGEERGRKEERHQEQQRQRRQQQQRVAIEIVVRLVHPATGASLPDEHVTGREAKVAS